MKPLILYPNDAFIGKTIREYLQHFNVGKAVIYKYSSNHLIKVNDVLKNSEYRIKKDDMISITLECVEKAYYTEEPIDIIFEDEDILVVNKPIDLLVHSDGNTYDTLTDRVGNHYQKLGYFHPVLPAHRIDKETSGIVIFGKHFISIAYLSTQFETRDIVKIYTCLVENVFTQKEGLIQSKLLRDPHSNKMLVSPHGKMATTTYKVIQNLFDQALLEVDIKSGRTHQIRAQLASIGHSVVGDPLYGTPKGRLMLHFSKISFKGLRDDNWVTFESKAPF